VNQAYLLKIAVATIILFVSMASGVNADSPGTVPAVQHWTAEIGLLTLPRVSHILIDADAGDDLDKVRSVAELLAADMAAVTDIKAEISQRQGSGLQKGSIVLHLGDLAEHQGEEAYVLEIGDAVHIRAASPSGLFYGTQTLLQWLKQAGGERSLPRGRAVDAPQFSHRGVMLDVGRKYYEISYLEQLIRNLAWLKLNTLHLHFSEWLAFRLVSDTYPGLAADEAYTKEDIRRLQDVAAQYFVDIVPEIDLPAHATAITEYEPRLGFKCESMRSARWQKEKEGNPDPAWTIDITREENRQWIARLLHEFIPVFDSEYFHIGGDEYQYDPQKYACPELMEAMESKGFEKPGDVFIEWLNEVNELVKSYGKTTQIWNWWRFHENETSIQPARDIIVNVWNLPRQEAIINDGYKVVLTPESLLYVSPGLEDPETGYGIFDVRKIYEDWNVQSVDSILGYKVSIWSDAATHHTDHWFEGKSYEPRAVIAEKNWGKTGSPNVEGFLKRLNRIGAAPPVAVSGTPGPFRQE
jgi:hexosaminidase